jgi:outer membrane lipoprotein SlyB
MELTHEYAGSGQGLLYPMLLIAALAVIVFSVVGIASIGGWMPNAMIGAGTAMTAETPVAQTSTTEGSTTVTPTFQCAECGVIESVREIERRGSMLGGPFAVFPRSESSYSSGI